MKADRGWPSPGVLVHDGVHLGVTDVHVLVLQLVLGGFPPGELVIRAPPREAVVAYAHYPLVLVDYAGAHLAAREQVPTASKAIVSKVERGIRSTSRTDSQFYQ